ncbi:MAG: hypothetical protein K9I26_01025 [Flavobacterium sp.]|nr:hypothetical protein [Flavobacterium sp.]
MEFFTSCAGGAYSFEELVYLTEPNHQTLANKLQEQKLDYGILVYIGHGANLDDNHIFQLNASEIIKAGQFVINSNKQIVIVESCRVLIKNIPTVDLADKIPAFAEGGIFRDRLNKEQSREIYESHIKRCEPGLMICYACSLGEEAYNFVFSAIFLQHAMDWHIDSSRHCAILPVDELMRLSFVDVHVTVAKKFTEYQNIYTEGSTNFPIAVSKY